MNDIIVYDHYEIVEGEPTTKNVGDYSLMSDSVNDIQLVEMWANKPRKSQYDLVSQLRGRRRSVEAEIKRVQAETPIDATRAATNAGYLMALEIELSFLAGILDKEDS